MVAIQDQYQQGHRSAKLMESQGGFASSLASAYYKADMGNAIKLIAAFPDLFKQSPITAEAN